MGSADKIYRQMLKGGVNSTSGPTQEEREEANRRRELGERQARTQREREERVERLRAKQAEKNK